MYRENNIIIFKSKPEFYNKEKLGIKPNTIRKMENYTEDNIINWFKDFIEYYGEDCNAKIRIINSKSKESFERIITDISKFEDFYIISWKHE